MTARHERPDDLKRPLCTYIYNCKHLRYATRCMSFLGRFCGLEVWRVQYSGDNSYTCWYAGFKHKEEPYILNFNISSKNIEVEFRHPQYLPINVRIELRKNQNWRCGRFNDLTEGKLARADVTNALLEEENR